MLKLFLITAAVGLAAAGVWDTKWMANERINPNRQLTQDAGLDSIDFDPIKRMSFDELLKQRFLVKILDNVQQPLMAEEVCPVSDTFVMDENNYKKGIDMDMMFVCELCRNMGQLKRGDSFNIRNKDHLRQMTGLQRILARSIDWETFNQNACFARKEMNEVLFVNAFLLAVRQREDTQRLVIPGIHEILPEVFLDWDIVRAVRNVDFKLLSETNERGSMQPNFFEMMGLGGRTNAVNSLGNRKDNLFGTSMWMPWRQLRMQMAKSKTLNNNDLITSDLGDKIIIPVERRLDVTRDMTLLTNDVGLQGFIQFLVNNLCLRESELRNKRMGRVNLYPDTRFTTFEKQKMTNFFDGSDRSGLRFEDVDMGQNRYVPLRTNQLDVFNKAFDGSQRTETMFDFPTTSIDNDRLLHINYRRLLSEKNNMGNDNFQTRNDNRYHLQDFIRGNRDQDIRQTSNEQNDGTRFSMRAGKQWGTDRGTDSFRLTPSDRFDNMRGQQKQAIGDRYMTVLRGSQIYEGRHSTEQLKKGTLREREREEQKMLVNDQNPWGFNSKGNWDDERMIWNRKKDDFSYSNLGHDSRIDQFFDEIRKNSNDDVVYTTDTNDDRLLYKNRRSFNGMDDDISKRNFKINDEKIYSPWWNDRTSNDFLDDKRFNGMAKRTINNLNEGTRAMRGDVQEFEKMVPRSDVLLHNLKQIVARIENEKVSLGLENTISSDNGVIDLIFGNIRNADDAQNIQIRAAELREVREYIQDIFSNINIGMDLRDPMTLDQIMANTLLNSDGKLNILDIFRDILGDVEQDQRSAINMGVNLNNPLVQNVLKYLCNAIELQRTKTLGTYTQRDLGLDGVIVNNVVVDQLKTFIDLYDVDVRNLFNNRNVLSHAEQKMVVAKLQRLNHKDFTIKIDLDSDRSRQVMIRTFLGPKVFDQEGQELQFDEIRQKFMLLDSNIVNLQSGKNIIKRKSRDLEWTSRDTTPLTQIYKRVMIALDTRLNAEWSKKVVGQDCRFPHRLTIPRGRIDGIQMQLFVIVTNLENGVIVRDDLTCAMGVGTRISDGRSLGFPLDRRVGNVGDLIALPNVKITEVIVGHEEQTLKDF